MIGQDESRVQNLFDSTKGMVEAHRVRDKWTSSCYAMVDCVWVRVRVNQPLIALVHLSRTRSPSTIGSNKW